MTPTCLRALYGIPSSPGAVPGNSLGLYEQGDYFDKADLDLSLAAYAPWVPPHTYPIPNLIDGAQYDFPQNNTEFIEGEALIDLLLA
jgi:tripeptidyl-peptidase I